MTERAAACNTVGMNARRPSTPSIADEIARFAWDVLVSLAFFLAFVLLMGAK